MMMGRKATSTSSSLDHRENRTRFKRVENEDIRETIVPRKGQYSIVNEINLFILILPEFTPGRRGLCKGPISFRHCFYWGVQVQSNPIMYIERNKRELVERAMVRMLSWGAWTLEVLSYFHLYHRRPMITDL